MSQQFNGPLKRGRRKYLWQRLHNPSGITTSVFIVGCGRSGTSMLLHHLGRSWSVDSYNENDAAAFEKFRLRSLDTVEALTEGSFADVILFKPVLTTPHSREYLTRFPAARLVFVFRHYNDVVNSSIKRFGPADRLAHVNDWMANDFAEFAPIVPPEATRDIVRRLWRPDLTPESAAALYWLFYNGLYFDLELDLEERALLIGYERLVAEPENEIRAVCDFLNLGFEPVMIEGIVASSIGRDDKPSLDPDVQSACESLLRRLWASAGDNIVEQRPATYG